MASPLRNEFPGAIYHVTVRAVTVMFIDAVDRERLLAFLAEAISKHGLVCHAYCLMDNHLHLLVETPEPSLGAAMRDLNSRYARFFNLRHGRRGPLLERRYGAVPIERDAHLLEVIRYIVLNRARAGLCNGAADWPWSSHRATAGLVATPRFLRTDWVLGNSKETVIGTWISSPTAHPRRHFRASCSPLSES